MDALFLRKLLVAFAVGAGAYFLGVAPDVVDLFESNDWEGLESVGKAALFGTAAAGFRAVIALLTAFVPSDAQYGANILGKYKDAG